MLGALTYPFWRQDLFAVRPVHSSTWLAVSLFALVMLIVRVGMNDSKCACVSPPATRRFARECCTVSEIQECWHCHKGLRLNDH